jgi:hypothetical protein
MSTTTAVSRAATMRGFSAMRCCGMRRAGVRSAGMGGCSMSCARSRASSMRGCRMGRSIRSPPGYVVRMFIASMPAACIGATGCCAAAAVIASAAIIHKPMAAPAVTIAPACPWTHAQEDPVIEVPRPVETNRRAGIGRVVVIAIRAYRLHADVNAYLRLCHWRQRHGSERQ